MTLKSTTKSTSKFVLPPPLPFSYKNSKINYSKKLNLNNENDQFNKKFVRNHVENVKLKIENIKKNENSKNSKNQFEINKINKISKNNEISKISKNSKINEISKNKNNSFSSKLKLKKIKVFHDPISSEINNEIEVDINNEIDNVNDDIDDNVNDDIDDNVNDVNHIEINNNVNNNVNDNHIEINDNVNDKDNDVNNDNIDKDKLIFVENKRESSNQMKKQKVNRNEKHVKENLKSVSKPSIALQKKHVNLPLTKKQISKKKKNIQSILLFTDEKTPKKTISSSDLFLTFPDLPTPKTTKLFMNPPDIEEIDNDKQDELADISVEGRWSRLSKTRMEKPLLVISGKDIDSVSSPDPIALYKPDKIARRFSQKLPQVRSIFSVETPKTSDPLLVEFSSLSSLND